ncbi:hypothetical protein [Qaidamihabitans albus]|uniref:hypothetical protein n=1 Tax=Qaidamihabitans albus TaxID=2795733 RepID=UPI0018F26CA6|nr:hypothetical protein [Qaidamihabitans albus]
MAQLSFFSAEASRPRLADLAGLLCGRGQVTSFGRTAARVSTVVDEDWRARALARECARYGADAQVTVMETDEGRTPLIRTAFRVDLLPLARLWAGGQAKSLPPGFALGGSMLRIWALASGRPGERDYLLHLDPDAPDTHAPLAAALGALGLPVTTVRPRGGGPAIRISGRRRLETLAELVGAPPAGAEPAWPGGLPVRKAG